MIFPIPGTLLAPCWRNIICLRTRKNFQNTLYNNAEMKLHAEQAYMTTAKEIKKENILFTIKKLRTIHCELNSITVTTLH